MDAQARPSLESDAVLDALFVRMQDLDGITPRPLLRVEYDKLVELGVFDDENVELLRGRIVRMSPEGLPHAAVSVWLTRRLIRGLDDEFVVRPDKSFAANDDSQPEPDFVVTREDPRLAHPSTALLVIEVSHSSLRKDRGIKRQLYAEVGVPEYWIIDVSEAGKLSVEVHTEPTPHGFARMVTLRDADVLRPHVLPIEIAMADVPR